MRDPPRPVFCLVVEDDPVAGLDLADVLEAAGFYVAGPFRSGRETVKWLERFTPDVAVIDLALPDGPCRELVAMLQARGIGFVAHSGDRRRRDLLGLSPGGLQLDAPSSDAAIVAALQGILRRAPEHDGSEPLAALQQK